MKNTLRTAVIDLIATNSYSNPAFNFSTEPEGLSINFYQGSESGNLSATKIAPVNVLTETPPGVLKRTELSKKLEFQFIHRTN